MKQRINFYTDDFKPKREYLTLENMMMAWFAAIILVLALYNLESKKVTIAKTNYQMAEKREQHQQRQLQSLQSSFAERGDAVVLEKTLEAFQANLVQREFVLEQLGLKADGMAKGVASLMRDLADRPIKDLWLTEIEINQGQLSLSGLTKDVEKIPQLIKRLQKLKSIHDRRFARLAVNQVEDQKGMLSFTLQSTNQVIGQDEKKGRSR